MERTTYRKTIAQASKHAIMHLKPVLSLESLCGPTKARAAGKNINDITHPDAMLRQMIVPTCYSIFDFAKTRIEQAKVVVAAECITVLPMCFNAALARVWRSAFICCSCAAAALVPSSTAHNPH